MFIVNFLCYLFNMVLQSANLSTSVIFFHMVQKPSCYSYYQTKCPAKVVKEKIASTNIANHRFANEKVAREAIADAKPNIGSPKKFQTKWLTISRTP